MTILAEFNAQIAQGIEQALVFELVTGREVEVKLYMDDEYFYFTFKEETKPSFDGDIVGKNGSYGYEYNEQYDNLQSILDKVYFNILDGYIGELDLSGELQQPSPSTY